MGMVGIFLKKNCGQPDNCGDCSYGKPLKTDVEVLGGKWKYKSNRCS